MIVLDTNVVSEPFRPQPDLRVRAWLDAQPAASLFICSPVLAELRFGLERLPAGARKDRLRVNIDAIEHSIYRGRILPLDAAAAGEYGRIAAERERIGRRMQQMDALIAAIALAHYCVLATRDTADFADLGLELIDPFEASGPNR
jgi:predicted nucleic acid-binding protein